MARSCDAGNRSWAPVKRAGPAPSAPSAPSCAMPVSLCVCVRPSTPPAKKL